MSRMTIGIIGCGRMGRERARHIADYGAEVVAFDTQPERALELSRTIPQCKPLGTEGEIPWAGLSAVFLCTPPAYRRSALERALTNGVPVFIEKPFATTSADAAEMAAAIEAAGIAAAVGYMNRYRESVRVAREVLRASRPLAIAAYWTCGRYAVPWWENPEISGGPFNEQATHLVDLVRYLGGEFSEVRAIAVDGTRVSAAIRLDTSCCATLLYSCDAREKYIGIEAITGDGRLRLSGWDFALTENTIDGRVVNDTENAFATETRAFLDAAAGVRTPSIRCLPRDAAATQAAVDAIRESYAGQFATSAL